MIEIRPCEGFDELQACVQLQIETWGYDESDIMPRKTFRVAQCIGGQVIGAFDRRISPNAADALVGFVFSMPGVKTGTGEPHAYLHSHMLAVRETHRNQGLGRALKLEQRREALARGIRHIEWTFDPLEIKNAFLNIHRLGAIVRSYCPDFYGVSSSRLQGGLPTDRLVAEWWLETERVRAIIGGQPAAGYSIGNPIKIEKRIKVPASIYQWKASDAERARALAVQSENRVEFQKAFAQGLAVLDFTRDGEGNGIFELGPLALLELN